MPGSILMDYIASASAYVHNITGLASSSTKVAGRQTSVVDNSTNEYPDYLVSGQITIGASATAGSSIDIYTFGNILDTPTYPTPVTGTATAVTFTVADQRTSVLKLVASIPITNSTSSVTFYFGPIGLAQFFGGFMPRFHGLFVVHDCVSALSATTASQNLYYQPVAARYT